MGTTAVDEAYENLAYIFKGVEDIDIEQSTEADTRINLIDPILKSVLGWLPGQIECERSADGNRVDYILRTITNTAIVEAKKESKLFDLGTRGEPQKLLLNSIYLSTGIAGEAVQQVKEYAQDFGVGLAVATNGAQWIIFLASRTDGKAVSKGTAYVFRSKDELLEPKSFKLFYELLAKRNVQLQSYTSLFSKTDAGLRSPSPPSAKRLVDTRKGHDQKRGGSTLSQALAPVLDELFLSLSKDKEREVIRNCFVTTKESIEADSRLERLLEEITNKIKTVDTRDGSDVRLTKVVQETVQSSISQTVLIIGHVGSGKSTYLDRFFELVLPPPLKKKVIVVRLDLEHAQPQPSEFTPYLHREFIKALKDACFKTSQPEFEQLQGAFIGLYDKRRKGEYKFLYQNNIADFNVEFGKALIEMEEHNQEQYIRELLAYCNSNLQRLVCVVLDNIDHHENEIQNRAFLSAKWLSGLGKVLCILPLRDSTYWQASIDGPFHTRNQTTLYLPRPPLAEVLQARFEYAELQLEELDKKNPVTITSLHGFRVKANNAKELFQCLHKIFGREVKPNLIIRGLSGGNIREALRLFYACMTSPHMNVDRLLAAYLNDGNYRLNHRDLLSFEKAAILADWQCYKSERNKTVANLLSFPKQFENSPLMGLRLLERLYDLRTDSQSQTKGFESLNDLIAYFKLMAVPPQITDKTILDLVNARLIEPYNLSVLAEQGLRSTERIESVALSDSGRLLRYWSRKSAMYGLEMIQDIPVYDEETFNELLGTHITRFEGFAKKNYAQVKDAEARLNLRTKHYLNTRDKEFVFIPNEPLFASQMRLENVLLNWSASDDYEYDFG